MSKIRTLIIDDEHLARQIIRGFLEEDDDVEIVRECGDGFEGFKQINELNPDLVFLDVMMPKLTGFEMLELIEKPPVIIFSTAYDEYAIKAFEQNAVDYLLKPYDKERFVVALEKAKAKLDTSQSTLTGMKEVIKQHQEKAEVLSRIAVRTGNKINILAIDQVRYIEAQDDYVKIYADEGSFLKQQTMKYYENHLPPDDFLRIHRSYIVRLKEVARVELMGKDTHVVFLNDGTQLAVSRSGYTRLKEVLGF
ncbi:MAG: LytTR family transcriptional regulator DNA-binding domain-containing protein [Ekhidna sp.]|uniref:LytR/AlgR family response regulator transcription factor n=1 Tax=Ekhidna sp. TaxID=2608089 RepID=UPI0032ED6AC5